MKTEYVMLLLKAQQIVFAWQKGICDLDN